MSAAFNKLAARKELGAIAHRLAEGLDRSLAKRIIARHIHNLSDTLPPETFGEVLLALHDANEANDIDEIHAGVLLLQSLIPLTLGALPAGATGRLPDGRVFIKRKDCLELYASCDTLEPIPYNTVVTIL